MESRTWGYARVSTKEQNLDRQLIALMESGVEERNIITDKESGKDLDRKGYQALKNTMLRRGDTLVIKSLDRLSRNKCDIKNELQYFQQNGVRLKVIDLPTTMIDFPAGQEWVMDMVNNILIEVLGTIAEQERTTIRQRQADGIAAAKQKGVALGRPKAQRPENWDEVIAEWKAGQIAAAKAMELTEQDNIILDQFRGKMDTTDAQIKRAVERLDYYEDADEAEIDKAVERIREKLDIINSEYMQWFEILLAFVFAIIGYMAPIALLMFQAKMRQIEMEDEVMQFQTIILMLMRIERVNVEMILEWLERYANIFKDPISKCLNNYEAGAWEALEAMKEEISYMPLVRIVESMQAAVEKIPIKDAFDELESERDYYQEKRKESNDRLIKRKGMIGKAIGFAPMVCMFVGYLIIPLVFIGLTSMSSSFTTMTAQTV